MDRWRIAAAAIGAIALAGTGCGMLPIGGSGKAISADQVTQKVYRLKIGDSINVSVWGHDDLNRSAQIREDGTIVFPLVGKFRIADLTMQEAEDELRRLLNKDFIVDPQVTIKLEDVKFTVLGEVQRPGSFELTGAMDLLTGLSLAGGINKFGAGTVDIIRETEEGHMTIQVSVDAILAGQEANVNIFPNDTIYVRRRLF